MAINKLVDALTRSNSHFLSGRGILLLSLLCTSCHKEGQWTQAQIYSTEKTSRSSKLVHRAVDPIYDLTFELIKTQEGLKGYLITHSTPYSSSSHHIPIKYTIDEESFFSEGYLLQGGQKILLSEVLVQDLINALQFGKKIEVTLKGYRTTLNREGFSQAFAKFENPQNYQNPFHLPF